MRFELNERGIEQLTSRYGPQDRSNGGVVLRENGNCWVVRFDNRKTPHSIHKSYLTIIDEAPPVSNGDRGDAA